MTGGELINRLYEEIELGGLTDAEIIQSDVVELLNKISIPTDYRALTVLTDADIEKGKSARGGFTRKQLARWGVPWPPPKGWRKRLTGKAQHSKITSLGADRCVKG
ncbi:MAG: hypothetical protein AABN95_16145 [Acidobacteriota bacterium]